MSTPQIALYGILVGGGLALIVVLAGVALRQQLRKPATRDFSNEKDWGL